MNPLCILSSYVLDPAQDDNWAACLPVAMKRRAPRIWQLAYAASKKAINEAGVAPKSVVCGTALGALDETRGYLDGVFKDGFGSPRHFIASVHNSMAGKLALEFKIDGPNLTVCEGQNSFASSIAVCSLLHESDFPALLLVIDENTELLRRIHPHLSAKCRDFINASWAEMAVAFVVTPSGDTPTLCSFGPVRADDPVAQHAGMRLASVSGFDAAQLLPLDQTSDSFVKPAAHVCHIIRTATRGTYLVGSYSPSSGAVALVSLCI